MCWNIKYDSSVCSFSREVTKRIESCLPRIITNEMTKFSELKFCSICSFVSSSFSVEEFNLVKDDSSKIGYLFIPDLHQRSLLKNPFCGRLLSCFFLSTETTEYVMFNLDTNSSKCTVHVHNSTNLVIDSLRAKRCGWQWGQVSCFLPTNFPFNSGGCCLPKTGKHRAVAGKWKWIWAWAGLSKVER